VKGPGGARGACRSATRAPGPLVGSLGASQDRPRASPPPPALCCAVASSAVSPPPGRRFTSGSRRWRNGAGLNTFRLFAGTSFHEPRVECDQFVSSRVHAADIDAACIARSKRRVPISTTAPIAVPALATLTPLCGHLHHDHSSRDSVAARDHHAADTRSPAVASCSSPYCESRGPLRKGARRAARGAKKKFSCVVRKKEERRALRKCISSSFECSYVVWQYASDRVRARLRP